MNKFSKSPPDAVQQKLRNNKAVWNKSVSEFINDLIHCKKLMNGAPNKFHMEKGNIKFPIPADPATIIGALSGDFNEIAQKGNAIISEQADYSKNRRKRQSQNMTQTSMPFGSATAPAAAPIDLSQQLSAAFEEKYGLVSEGSSKISRFFTRLFNPATGFGDAANLRRARMAMLNACAEAYRDLGKFQVQVVKSSKESINSSNQKLNEAWHYWTLVSRAYIIFKNSKSINAPDKGGALEKDIATQNLKEEKALEKIPTTNQQAAIPVDDTLQTTLDEPLDKAASSQIEKVAQDFMKKWVGKTIHQLSPFDSSSAYRLNCYKLAGEIRQQLDVIMNLLEKGLDEAQLDPIIKDINSKVVSLRGMMRSLHLASGK